MEVQEEAVEVVVVVEKRGEMGIWRIDHMVSQSNRDPFLVSRFGLVETSVWKLGMEM